MTSNFGSKNLRIFIDLDLLQCDVVWAVAGTWIRVLDPAERPTTAPSSDVDCDLEA